MNEQLSNLLTAMEILPDALLIVDDRQRIVGCNHVAESLFGYRHGELVEKPLSVLLPPAVHAAHTKHMTEYDPASGGRPMEGRAILCGVSKSGARLPLSIGISSVGEGAGRLFVAVARDARSFNDTLEDAKVLAETDPLTGLGNRRCLSSRLAKHDSNADDPRIGLLFLDLDRFKLLNDEHGHEVGDEVLRVVARRLRARLRNSDLCVRLGGDEFAVLVSGVTQPDDLERIALKLHAGVTEPIHVRATTITVGVSIGGVIGWPHRFDADELFDRADHAMYQAKTQNRPYCYHAMECTDAA